MRSLAKRSTFLVKSLLIQELHDEGKNQKQRGREENSNASDIKPFGNLDELTRGTCEWDSGATPKPKSNWVAAAKLGLVSSSFSTIVSQLFAARLGRDAFVDWMTVAVIPLRDGALSAEPSWSAVITGIAFHQWADFSWAVVFFGLFGRWTAALSPLRIFLLAMPWAVFSSASEWFLLVPLFPFWQPVFTLQQPYWIGLLVHMASASMYPLFAWLRWPLGHAPKTRDVTFAKAWRQRDCCHLRRRERRAVEPAWLGVAMDGARP